MVTFIPLDAMFRKIFPVVLALVLTVLVGAMFLLHNQTRASAEAVPTKGIVGAWYVDTTGAPFEPHGIIFHADGTLVLTNPDAAEATNSSSAGYGEWVPVRIEGQPGARGSFFEVNADKNTNQFTTILVVTFQVRLSALQPGAFSGPAEATYYDGNRNVVLGPLGAVLKGQHFGVDGPVPDPLNE
jgi:hypothetical protein